VCRSCTLFVRTKEIATFRAIRYIHVENVRVASNFGSSGSDSRGPVRKSHVAPAPPRRLARGAAAVAPAVTSNADGDDCEHCEHCEHCADARAGKIVATAEQDRLRFARRRRLKPVRSRRRQRGPRALPDRLRRTSAQSRRARHLPQPRRRPPSRVARGVAEEQLCGRGILGRLLLSRRSSRICSRSRPGRRAPEGIR
jgi:hypothetical protein